MNIQVVVTHSKQLFNNLADWMYWFCTEMISCPWSKSCIFNNINVLYRAYFSRDLNFANDSKIGFHGTIFHKKSLSSTSYAHSPGTFRVLIFENCGKIHEICEILDI